MKKKSVILSSVLALVSTYSLMGHARSIGSLSNKAQRAAEVINEAVNSNDHAIPQSLLEKSLCVVTIPDVMRIGLGIGARVGRGLVSCRGAEGWSKPSFIKIKSGSIGFQIGFSKVDMVIVIVNPIAIAKMSSSTFTLGGDLSVTAGPIGRDAKEGIDYELKSGAYSYAKSRGIYAGLTLEGSKFKMDYKSNKKVYRTSHLVQELLTSNGDQTPLEIKSYVDSLNRNIK